MNSRKSIAIRQTIALGGLLLVALFLVAKCTGCVAGAAEAAYTAALVRCVDKAETLSESRACRSAVDAKWGLKDAGSDR